MKFAIVALFGFSQAHLPQGPGISYSYDNAYSYTSDGDPLIWHDLFNHWDCNSFWGCNNGPEVNISSDAYHYSYYTGDHSNWLSPTLETDSPNNVRLRGTSYDYTYRNSYSYDGDGDRIVY